MCMENSVKTQIYQLLENINDEIILNQLMEDLTFYATNNNNQLSSGQLTQLDEAIKEADNNETITWDEFKKDMTEWRKK